MNVWNGSLPKDWRVERLGALSQVKGGKRLPKGEKLVPNPTPFPYIRVCDFKDFSVDLGDIHYLTPEIQEKISPYIISKDDVFISIAGTIGRVGTVPERLDGANLTENAARIVLNEQGQLEQDFLKYCLASPQIQGDIASRRSKNAQPKLALAQIKDLEIPVPPPPEQKKIAHILSTVQRAIEAQERIIRTTTELKKALMHKFFTEGLRNEPQKQTEIGPVPESWEVVALSEIARIERGKFSHRPRNEPRFYGGEYPFVQTGDVSNCDGNVRSYTQTLNEDGLAISKMFPAGTILITIAANIGFTGILEFDSACPDSLIGISPSERVQTEFLNYYLIAQQPAMDQLAPKGTQKNINIQFLKPWPVPLPSVEEQEEIAEAFSTADQKIRVATEKRNQLQDLFRTLLHELMTAKTRVHDFKLSTG